MIKEKLRYTKTGKRIESYEFDAKLHQKVVMDKFQFENHILVKHPEITLEIIKEVLENPDIVTKQSKSKKEHFYQKKINNLNYFVVISQNPSIRKLRFVVTAFMAKDTNFLKEKNKYIRYKTK